MVDHLVPYLQSFGDFFRSRSDSCVKEVSGYVSGLLTARHGSKNIERMSETVADFSYQNVHHAISSAKWSSRAVMDEVAARANGLLGGGRRPRLVLDDSGMLKKGRMSVGVARQYLGCLGKVDNGQVAVCASLACGQRSTLVDMRLYLPEEWADDPKRCDKAGIPQDQRRFRTKAQMAREIVAHQRRLGTGFEVVSMDSGYGSDAGLLRDLDADGETYVAEVHCDQRIWSEHPWPHREGTRPGRKLKKARASQASQRVDEWSKDRAEDQWRRLKVRDSDQGWVEVSYLAARAWIMHEDEAQPVWVLCWENPDETSNNGRQSKLPRRHYALSNAAAGVDERQLIADGLGRNVVERNFREAKQDAGMADYQVRGWDAWHHHMALVMMAMLFLTQERMQAPAVETEQGPVTITAGDIAFMLERLLPQRGRPPGDLAEAKKMLLRRITQRTRDQVRRRRKTASERPPLWPDEDFTK